MTTLRTLTRGDARCSTEDSPARTFLRPELGEACTACEAAGAGPPTCRPSRRLGLGWWSWRMSDGFARTASAWFCASLPASGSMRSGALSERSTLERPISGAASSSSPHEAPYPTPSASAYGSSGNGTGNNTRSRGRPSLEQQARNWRTPLARDGKGKTRQRDSLPNQVATWPTATATDSKDSARHTTTTGIMHSGTTLLDAVRSHPRPTTAPAGNDGDELVVLNPAFVEAMMGFPPGWTHVEDEPACVALEMPFADSKRSRRSSNSPADSQMSLFQTE